MLSNLHIRILKGIKVLPNRSSNLSTIRFEEEKSINELCQNLSQKALKTAVENIGKKVNSSIQKKIILQNIDKLSSKALIQG